MRWYCLRFWLKVAFDNGIPRRTSYIFIATMFAVMVSCSTLFFLPKNHIDEAHLSDIKRRRSSMKRKNDSEKDAEPDQYVTEKLTVATPDLDDEAAKQLGTTESLLNGSLLRFLLHWILESVITYDSTGIELLVGAIQNTASAQTIF